MGYKRISGIYRIKVGDKSYIGSSTNINKRIWHHGSLLKHGEHWILEMQELYNRGIKLESTIIELCTIKDLIKRECYWIDKYDSIYNGYNKERPDDPGRNRRIENSGGRVYIYAINIATGIIIRIKLGEFCISRGINIRKCRDACSYWKHGYRDINRIRKSISGWVLVHEQEYDSTFDYIKGLELCTVKINFQNRVKNRISERKARKSDDPAFVRYRGQKKVLVHHIETGEEIIYDSLAACINEMGLVRSKFEKVLYNEWGAV